MTFRFGGELLVRLEISLTLLNLVRCLSFLCQSRGLVS